MPSPLDALKTPIGPAPAWLWLVGGGLAIYLVPKLGLFGKSSSTIPASAPPAGTVPSGYVPLGSQPSYAPTTTPSSVLVTTPPPTVGRSQADIFWQDVLGQSGPAPTQDVTQLELGNISWQVQHGQITPQQATAGWLPRGGPRAPVGHSPVRRADAPWHWHGHPLLKAQAHFPHYVLAGRGGASVHHLARSAGLHPARLMAANPHLHYPGRGGPDDGYGGMGGFTDAMAQPDYDPPMTSRGPASGIASQDIGLRYMREPGAPLGRGGPRLPPHHVAAPGQLVRVR